MTAQPGVAVEDETGGRRSRATSRAEGERWEGRGWLSGYGSCSGGLSAFVSSSAWQAIGGRA